MLDVCDLLDVCLSGVVYSCQDYAGLPITPHPQPPCCVVKRQIADHIYDIWFLFLPFYECSTFICWISANLFYSQDGLESLKISILFFFFFFSFFFLIVKA
jgi:hypothetical protein